MMTMMQAMMTMMTQMMIMMIDESKNTLTKIAQQMFVTGDL